MFGKTVLKGIMLIFNVVAVSLMGFTWIGSIISPEKILFPAYFSLFYPYVILLNIGFVLFWLIARKWLFLLSLSVLLLSSVLVSETFPVHFGKTPDLTDRKPINILTYNTMMSGKLVKNTKKNPNKVLQYIVNSDADIVCLQEFMVSKKNIYQTHADMLRTFRKYPYKHICYMREVKSKFYGIATFSKFPIINRKQIHYSSFVNGSIYSDLVIQGETIRLVNNHLESNRITENDKAMPFQLKNKFDADNLTGITLHFTQKLGLAYKLRASQADVVADTIRHSPYKVLVCGDFNDVPTSYAYTKVKGNLCDAFQQMGTGLGWTYHEGYYKFRIDYVLYDSTAFEPVKYKADKVNYSDHYPVLCQIRLKHKY